MAAPAIMAGLRVIIGGNARGAIAAFAKSAAAAKIASKGIQASMAVAKAAVLSFAALATGGIIALMLGIKRATTTFIAFEESMFRIKAIMQNELGGETAEATEKFNKLESEIRNVAKASQFTARQVGEAAQVLALAGLTVDNLVKDKAIKNIVDFSIAAGTDVQTAAGIGISAVKGFGLEINQLDRVMDVMTNTFTSSFTDLQSLGEAMKFLAPTAKSAGIEIEEAAAAIGAMGNAGLQGSIAGTGLRMAINKLISPSEEARKSIERLGLDFFRLTPAGDQAKDAMRKLQMEMNATERDVDNTTIALQKLNDEMADLNITQQRNSLQIAEIRARASKQNRDLTEREIEAIQKLESANDDLGLEQQRLSLRQAEANREAKRTKKNLEDQKTRFKELNDVVSQQTTGITSFEDVLSQLNASGATTAEILEIFGVRGGTAITALAGQTDAFLAMKDANEQATGATENFVNITKGTTSFALKEVASNFEETGIVIGRFLAEFIKMDGGIADGMTRIAEVIRENEDAFKELITGGAQAFLAFLEELPVLLPIVFDAMKEIGKIIQDLIPVFKFFLLVMKPVLLLLEGIVKLVGLITSGGSRIGSAISEGFGAFKFGGGSMKMGAFAEGGIVTQPTLGLVGEAGPEAIVPLNQARSPGSILNDRSQSVNVRFDSIVINGDTSVTEQDVKRMLETTMPRLIKDSFSRGSRGVI